MARVKRKYGPQPPRAQIMLQELMRLRGVTQAELARWTGLQESSISRLRRGGLSIRMTTVSLLCEALEVEVGELIVYRRRRREPYL